MTQSGRHHSGQHRGQLTSRPGPNMRPASKQGAGTGQKTGMNRA
jgi:hypothetical protein